MNHTAAECRRVCLRQFALTCFVIVMVSVPLLMSQDLAAASSGAKRLLDTLNKKRMAACDAAWEESADAEEGKHALQDLVAETWTTVLKDLDCLDPPRLGLCRRN